MEIGKIYINLVKKRLITEETKNNDRNDGAVDDKNVFPQKHLLSKRRNFGTKRMEYKKQQKQTYTPQQNNISERLNRTVANRVRLILI